MGRKLVVTSGKGGVGKTTVSANIAASLALLGRRVLLIDADSGLCNLDSTLGLEDEVIYTLDDIFLDRCRPQQALIQDKRYPGLYLLAGARQYDDKLITKENLCRLSEMFAQEFDFVMIDCPGGIENGFTVATAAADEALVVTAPDICAIRDADKIIDALHKQHYPSITLIINKVDLAMIRSEQTMDLQDIVDILNVPVAGVIPLSREVPIHANLGMIICARNFDVSKAFRQTGKNILNREMIDVEECIKSTFLYKLRSAFGL